MTAPRDYSTAREDWHDEAHAFSDRAIQRAGRAVLYLIAAGLVVVAVFMLVR